MRRTSRRIAAALILALAPAWVASSRSVEVGQEVANLRLPAVGGGAGDLLGREAVNVVAFVRIQQEASLDALRMLAECEKLFSGRPVRFVSVVPSVSAAAEVEAVVRSSGVRMPVLLDEKDEAYERLAIRLHPTIDLIDGKGRLAARYPYQAVNFRALVEGRIRLLLGEIDEAAFERIARPPEAPLPGADAGAVARREVNLGRLQLERGDAAKAIESAKKALARDPACSDAHTLLGRALAAQGDCAAAVLEFDAALALDPNDATAAAGKADCARRSGR